MPSRYEYQKLKELGLCGRCGKNKPMKGHTICAECHAKMQKYNKKQRVLCDKCTKSLICDKDRSKPITDCDDFDSKYKKYKDPAIQPIKPTRPIPKRWPYGWCYVCCKQLDDKNSKLCKDHADWIYLPKKKG